MFCVGPSVLRSLCLGCVHFATYGYGQIGVKEKLEVDGLGIRVLEAEVDVQVVLGQVDSVRQLGGVGPLRLVIRAQGSRVKEEFQSHAGTILLRRGRIKGPGAVAGEAVRRQLRCLALLWWRSEVGKDDRDAAADGSAAVEG